MNRRVVGFVCVLKNRLTMALVCAGLIAAMPPALHAEAPPVSVLPREGTLLVLPKGKPVTVMGMTTAGGKPEKQPTSLTLEWNDNGLTAVFGCADSAIALGDWATAPDSSKTWKDDSVAVLLDPGHRHIKQGTIAAKLSVAGGLDDFRGGDIAYKIEGITSEVSRTAIGWRGKIMIPWKGLGASPAVGDIWGAQFTRIDHEGKYSQETMTTMAWAPFKEQFEDLHHFGHLVFAAADAATDDASLTALREKVKQSHDVIASETVFPNAGSVLASSGKEPANAEAFTVVATGASPKQATRAALTWDASGLDIVVDCVDNGVVGDQKGDDNIKLWKDDSVYVWLDPGHTHNAQRHSIMVQVSASGAWHDIRNGDPVFDVEGLDVKASRTADGWRAHIKMPWKGLGVESPKPGDVWGINLTRMDQPGKTDYYNMQASSWVLIPDGDLQSLDRWGHIVFGGPPAAAQQAISTAHQKRRQIIGAQNGQ